MPSVLSERSWHMSDHLRRTWRDISSRLNWTRLSGMKNSVHRGVFSSADELITILRVDRQASPKHRSRMRISHDLEMASGLTDFMLRVLSCSKDTTELLKMTLSVNSLESIGSL